MNFAQEKTASNISDENNYLDLSVAKMSIFTKKNDDPNCLIVNNHQKEKSSNFLSTAGFAYYEVMGKRETQEDSLIRVKISEDILDSLTNEEIGMRLWTAHRNLNDKITEAGTTACSTICTKNALITATISDTMAFAIIYFQNDSFSVKMLSNKFSQLDDENEMARIITAGGSINHDKYDSVQANGKYYFSRSIGDNNSPGICADSDIHILDFNTLKDVKKIQLLTACDGFIEPLIDDFDTTKPVTKENCEEYLRNKLIEVQNESVKKISICELEELYIARQLVENALENCSHDNITIVMQSIDFAKENFNGLIGVYDGHDGHQASSYVVNNIEKEVVDLLSLDNESYASLKHSVHKNLDDYLRDNIEPTLTSANLKPKS